MGLDAIDELSWQFLSKKIFLSIEPPPPRLYESFPKLPSKDFWSYWYQFRIAGSDGSSHHKKVVKITSIEETQNKYIQYRIHKLKKCDLYIEKVHTFNICTQCAYWYGYGFQEYHSNRFSFLFYFIGIVPYT